jgi:hypothetical protein
MVEVNFKDLRAAVVDLNKSGLIKKQVTLVGVAKEKIYEDFMAAMDKIEDDPKTGEFPKGAEVALNYFNKMVDEEKKDKVKTVEKEKPEKAAKTKPAKEKTEKPAKTEKKEKTAKIAKPVKEKGPGVILSILEIIRENQPISKEDIAKKLAKRFPDREEKSLCATINAQIGGKSPTRMEKEKNIVFKMTKDGEYKLAK